MTTDLVDQTALITELEKLAKDAAAFERPKVSKISLKGGNLSIGEHRLSEKHIDVIILAVAYRHAWYGEKYSPSKIVNPDCFAVQATPEDMRPHANVKTPVNPTCGDCPKFQWGSATDSVSGKGKACKEGRRLVVIPADALTSADAIATAEMAIVDVPVTSLRNYGNYVSALSTTVKRPTWGVVTRLEVVPYESVFKLTFTPHTVVAIEQLEAIRARTVPATAVAITPYEEAALTELPSEKSAIRRKITG